MNYPARRVVETCAFCTFQREYEGPSENRVERLVVERLVVKRRLQQFRRRRIGWWRSQQGLLELALYSFSPSYRCTAR